MEGFGLKARLVSDLLSFLACQLVKLAPDSVFSWEKGAFWKKGLSNLRTKAEARQFKAVISGPVLDFKLKIETKLFPDC
ncbi:hypothetical protein HDC92_000226 [Pedobacter sp. AK017]|nr:hypothetical protein [Pedobacter sp. AK017]